jgi:RNA polymerase sigma factor (sigma-70 family)
MTTTHPGIVLRRFREVLTAKEARQVSDQELLDRFTGRHEEAAFEALVRRHGPLVLGVCRRVLHNWHDAEDVFQATFLVLARKADSVGRGGSVGSWLYQVAYHMALKARKQAANRKKREERTGPRPEPDPLADVSGRELLGVFDEELQNLPETQRASLVLCYLEGKTRDEAARQLGCSESTLKRRIEQAKERMRKRLARRGVALPAALLATTLAQTATAAVPGTLTAATARAAALVGAGKAAAGVVSARTAALVRDSLRALTVGKLKPVGAILVAISLLGTVAGLSTLGAPAAGAPEAVAEDAPAPAAKDSPRSGQPAPEHDRTMTVAGQVLGPDGKPVAAAQVAVLAQGTRRRADGEPAVERLGLTKADGEGRFEVQVRRTSGAREYRVDVLAVAAGYGLGWQALHPDAEQPQAVVRLYPGQPLRGRLVGLQGEPAAGVKVYLAYVTRPGAREEGDALGFSDPREHWEPWPVPVTTDAQGRFVFDGLGRGQVVGLDIRDDRFARQTLQRVEITDREPTLTLQPPQLLEGRVTCEDTGEPVPNARLVVRGVVRKPNEPTFENGEVTARADAQGRFRVNSFPGTSLDVWAYPATGTPYLGVHKEVVWPKGAVQTRLDVPLPRGVLVRGRVTEKASGRPVAGVGVDFWPRLVDNPHYRPDVVTGLWSQVVTGADGTFRIAVLPGPAHLGVQRGTQDFLQRPVWYDHGTGEFLEAPPPGRQQARRWFLAGVADLDVKPGAEPPEVQIALNRGVTVTGRLVGPDGKPAAPARMLCRLAHQTLGYTGLHPVRVQGGRFELPGCDPEKVYPVYFLDAKNELGAVAEVPGKPGDEPITVRLAPCGSAVLRLVDGQGGPRPFHQPHPAGLHLLVQPGAPVGAEPAGRQLPEPEKVLLSSVDPLHYSAGPAADAQGRVRLSALIPGATYRIQQGGQVKEFRVEAGKTVDLADIVIP